MASKATDRGKIIFLVFYLMYFVISDASNIYIYIITVRTYCKVYIYLLEFFFLKKFERENIYNNYS